jgi:hypothetical protein
MIDQTLQWEQEASSLEGSGLLCPSRVYLPPSIDLWSRLQGWKVLRFEGATLFSFDICRIIKRPAHLVSTDWKETEMDIGRVEQGEAGQYKYTKVTS